MTKTSRKLTACVFIVMVLGLGALSLRSFGDYGLNTDLNPVTGELARDVENHYDDGFPVRDLGTNLWAAINYLLFEEGRPGVTIGQHGWLFTDEEMYPGAEKEAAVETNLDRVVAVSDYLRSEGVPVAVLVVPSKARVYAGKLGDEKPVPLMDSLYDRFMERLSSEAVIAPNLLGDLAEAREQGVQVFLRTDTHWTPEGADVFARDAASQIRSSLDEQTWDQTEFVTRVGETRPHKGDLLTYLPLEPLFPALGPAPDTLTERSTAVENQGDDAAESLFADTSADIVLVGTSYSANPLWDFPGALKRHLGRDLINVADEGQGPFQPMTAYLESEEFRNHPPSLVVWEFPERYLAQPLKSEDTLAWFDQKQNLMAQSSQQGQSPVH